MSTSSNVGSRDAVLIVVVYVLLLQLDCDEDGGLRGEDDEPDFYVQAHMPV